MVWAFIQLGLDEHPAAKPQRHSDKGGKSAKNRRPQTTNSTIYIN